MNIILFLVAACYFIYGPISACTDDVLFAIFWMLAAIVILLFKREFE